ncbi:MAG: hypothetical protein JXO22_16990 [Phycisphaerae bacterium]|nr:hypothetical protein [Phycisphaerae bacterium]
MNDEHTQPENANTAPATDVSQDFAWEAHPARERPAAALLAIIVILALAALVYHLAGTAVAGVIAAIVLCLALQRFFFASRYELSADGITAATLMWQRRLRWDEVRLAQFGSQAAWISPLPRRSWREARRGVHVLFGPRRDEILTQLRARLPDTVEQRTAP